VLHIHGGPSVRADSWGGGFGFHEAQILASRGYAVVVPNFRITPGFGSKIFYSGFGTFGKQMSEDHEDKWRWWSRALRTPSAHASRARAGGYVALQAMVKTPGLFKCAVAGLAVTDLEFQVTTLEGDTGAARGRHRLLEESAGDRKSGCRSGHFAGITRTRSRARCFCSRPGRHSRPDQPDQPMSRALRSAGNPPAARRQGEGRPRIREDGKRADLYTQMLKFLDQQIGK
jgi:hypothetical protein